MTTTKRKSKPAPRASRKRYKTDWAALRYVAERSPVAYAAQILERNEKALAVLEAMVKEYRDEASSSYWSDRIEKVPIGCPHCQRGPDYTRQKSCPWDAACGQSVTSGCAASCTIVEFGGASLDDMLYSTVEVTYSSWSVTIFVSHGHTASDLAAARRFLKGHIEWAKRKYWGRKLRGDDEDIQSKSRIANAKRGE